VTYSLNDHWLTGAEIVPSPNHSERPADATVELLIIHNISLPPGEFGGVYVDQLFCNTLDCDAHAYFHQLRELRVSSHLLIDRRGRVRQYVPFDKQAWHAGESSFAGRTRCNEFSIGIELEGTDEQAFTDQQYASLDAITRLLMAAYPGIRRDRIVGHSDVAPGRKTDPGPCFDWQRFKQSLPVPEGN
jgi:AmpD protein